MHAPVSPDPYAQAYDAFTQGDRVRALQLLNELLKASPGEGRAWNLAGLAHHRGRDFGSAIHCFKHAVAAGAGAGAMTNLGFAHQKLEQYELAGNAYKQALRQDPRLPLAWQKLGGLMEIQQQYRQALDCYGRAVQLDPADLKSLGEALFLRRHLADWNPGVGPTPEQLLQALADASHSDFPPLLLLALPEADARMQQDAAARFGHSQWQWALSQPPLAKAARPIEGRRLRLAYFSSDFRNHAVSHLVSEVIAAHDTSKVEVFLYAWGPAPPDEWRQSALDAAEHFIEVGELDDREVARRIRDDRIDVLVDLNGYTLHARLGVLALRPAPVVVTWLGYIGTLGVPGLADYLIGDAVATPAHVAAHFSESPALMPGCYQPNGRLQPAMPAPSRSSQGLPEDAVVFCSFNQTFKLHPALWDDWCEILGKVPGSVLWLAPPRARVAIDNLRAEATRRGIDPARLVFAPYQSRAEHLARLALADVALDTWPYNSGTTASDALRAGVPLIAFLGDTFVGRMAGSLLCSAGLGECVAADRAGYVALAIDMGQRPSLREATRQRLSEGLAGSTLFRPDLFAHDLERLYRAMHEQKRAGLSGTIELLRER